MEEVKRDKITAEAEKIAEVRKEIYKSFAEKEVSAENFSLEALADCLRSYFEDMTEDEVLEQIRAIQTGMEKGAEVYADLYEKCMGKSADEQRAFLREFIDEKLGTLSKAQQRVALTNLLWDFCKNSNGEVEKSVRLYTTNMNMEDLKDKVCEMLMLKCRSDAEKSILAVGDAKDSVEGVEFQEYSNGYTEEQCDLIDAAAIYTVVRAKEDGDNKVEVDAAQFGESYALEKGLFQSMRDAVKSKDWKALTLQILSLASVVLGMAAIGWLFIHLYSVDAVKLIAYPTVVFLLLFPDDMYEIITSVISLPREIYGLLAEKFNLEGSRLIGESHDMTKEIFAGKKKEISGMAADCYGGVAEEEPVQEKYPEMNNVNGEYA